MNLLLRVTLPLAVAFVVVWGLLDNLGRLHHAELAEYEVGARALDQNHAALSFFIGQGIHYGAGCASNPEQCEEAALKYYLKARSTIAYLRDTAVEPQLLVKFDYPGMLNDLGLILANRGDMELAIKVYREALDIRPRLLSALSNLAGLLVATGNFAQAEDAYISAIEVLSKFPEDSSPFTASVISFNYGSLLQRLKRVPEAHALWEQAVRLEPNSSFLAQGNQAYVQCLQEHGKDSELKNLPRNRELDGFLLRETTSISDLPSFKAFESAAAKARLAGDLVSYFTLRLNQAGTLIPSLPPSTTRALVLRQAYLVFLAEIEQEAFDLYSRGLLRAGSALKSPLDVVGCGSLGYSFVYQGFADLLLRRRQAEVLYSMSSKMLAYNAPFLSSAITNQPTPRLKVGFLSAFWYHHSVGLLLQRIITGLSRHHRDTLDVHLVLLGLPESQFDHVTRALLDGLSSPSNALFLPFSTLQQAQNAIAALRLDVLVYSEIGMDSTTFALSFARLARRTVVFWGHAVSSGVAPPPTMTGGGDRGGPDYFVSSELFENGNSIAAQSRYSERLVLMPSLTVTFVKPPELLELGNELDNMRAVFGLMPVRREYPDPRLRRSLLQRGFLNSFYQNHSLPSPWSDGSAPLHLYSIPQTLYKLHPDADELWLSVLLADPSGILVLIGRQNGPLVLGNCGEKVAQELLPTWGAVVLGRFRAALEIAGASNLGEDLLQRVVFLPSLTSRQFITFLALSDVVLDPFPLGGGRSSFEAFSVPVPIVLLYPRTSILQLTYGMYSAMGFEVGTTPQSECGGGGVPLRCCVCHSPTAFVQEAVALASNTTYGGAVRREIQARSSVLFDEAASGALDDWVEMLHRITATSRPEPVAVEWDEGKDGNDGLWDPGWSSEAGNNSASQLLPLPFPSARQLGFVRDEWLELVKRPAHRTPLRLRKVGLHKPDPAIAAASAAGRQCYERFTLPPPIHSTEQGRVPIPPLDALQLLFLCSMSAGSAARAHWPPRASLHPVIEGQILVGWSRCWAEDGEGGGACIGLKKFDDLSLALKVADIGSQCKAASQTGSAGPAGAVAEAETNPDGSIAVRLSLASLCAALALPGPVSSLSLSLSHEDKVWLAGSDLFAVESLRKAAAFMEEEGSPMAVRMRERAKRAWLLEVQSASATATGFGGGTQGLEGFDVFQPSSQDKALDWRSDLSSKADAGMDAGLEDGITLVITTSKRLSIFARTSTALVRALPCLAFAEPSKANTNNLAGGEPTTARICRAFARGVLVVDDRSSPEDRAAMLSLQPHWQFVWLNATEDHVNGHARSLNTALASVTSRFLLYLEDDWLSLGGEVAGGTGTGTESVWGLSAALSAALDILSPSKGQAPADAGPGRRGRCRERVAQVLLNSQVSRSCALGLANCDITSLSEGGWPRHSSWGLCNEDGTEQGTEPGEVVGGGWWYLLHEFGFLDATRDFSYWPGLSFNPALWDLQFIRARLGELLLAQPASSGTTGLFADWDRHFEQRFSVSGFAAGLSMAFLPSATFAHVGNDESAYVLNDQRRRHDK